MCVVRLANLIAKLVSVCFDSIVLLVHPYGQNKDREICAKKTIVPLPFPPLPLSSRPPPVPKFRPMPLGRAEFRHWRRPAREREGGEGEGGVRFFFEIFLKCETNSKTNGYTFFWQWSNVPYDDFFFNRLIIGLESTFLVLAWRNARERFKQNKCGLKSLLGGRVPT